MNDNTTNTLENYTFTDGEVYYVRSQQDDTVILAIDPKIQGSDLVWFDTVKERIKPVTDIIVAESNEFSFHSNDVIYSFLPLTIDLYEKYVKQHLLAPTPYLDLEDLKRQIVATKESAW